MGVNWDSGVLFWKEHTPSATAHYYTLSHLHPFVQRIELAATGKNPARTAELYVAFGLHTFTRAIEPGDGHQELYRDNRETRTFCPTRYRRSFELPAIVRTLETRRCEFARGMSGLVNYVTVETTDGQRYAAFFEVRRLKTVGSNAVQLMVQSAYILERNNRRRGRAASTFTRCWGMCSAEQPRDRLPEAAFPGPQKAKPRLWRGFVIPDPLTCHRGRPLARRACTKPVFVHGRKSNPLALA